MRIFGVNPVRHDPDERSEHHGLNIPQRVNFALLATSHILTLAGTGVFARHGVLLIQDIV